MILHVAKLEKFIPPFIDFIDKNFDIHAHRFWIKGNAKKFPYKKRPEIYNRSQSLLHKIFAPIIFIYWLHKADKIILHSLTGRALVRSLFFMPWLLKKCYWVIWGGDLYSYLDKKNHSWNTKEYFRRKVIRNIGHLITYVEGDVDLARNWYNAKGKHHSCLMYPSNLYKKYDIKAKNNSSLNIQVGNSADPSNNHIEVFDLLKNTKIKDMTIYTPLSYGKNWYSNKIECAGYKEFGEKFQPLKKFMPLNEYIDLLSTIDIAIFNHKRQQAMGNIITLLGLGKTVYMRNDITSWKTLTDLGITLYPTEGDLNKLLPDDLAEKNKSIVASYFTEDRLNEQLKEIFETKTTKI